MLQLLWLLLLLSMLPLLSFGDGVGGGLTKTEDLSRNTAVSLDILGGLSNC
jgi:hypothetical protein